MKNTGTIVEWTDAHGNECRGIAYDRKQSPSLMGRMLVNMVDKNMLQMKDESGKSLCTVKFKTNLKIVGFVD